MLPDDIGRVLPAMVERMGQTPLDIGPRQVDDGAELVDGLVGMEPEVAKAQAQLQMGVVGLAVPASGIPLQRLLGGQGEIRTDKVHRVTIPAVPSRYQPTDVEGDLAEATNHISYQIGRFRTVRSGYVHAGIPPVPLGQIALLDVLTI